LLTRLELVLAQTQSSSVNGMRLRQPMLRTGPAR
jgi:hypothetical protein